MNNCRLVRRALLVADRERVFAQFAIDARHIGDIRCAASIDRADAERLQGGVYIGPQLRKTPACHWKAGSLGRTFGNEDATGQQPLAKAGPEFLSVAL